MKTSTSAATLILAMSNSYLAHGRTTFFNATFDTLVPILEQGPINPIGTYLNLTYTSIDFRQPNTTVTGLLPQSPPNYAIGTGSLSNPAAIMVSPLHPSVDSFALHGFYYGCITNGAEAAAAPALPVPCTITATGYGADTLEPVAVQEFAFAPGPRWREPLAEGTFEAAFQGLGYVTFAQSPGAGTEFVLDDIVGSLVET